MCRTIKTLFNFAPPASEHEIRASALQFVRKLSGCNAPSKAGPCSGTPRFRSAHNGVIERVRSTRARRAWLMSMATTLHAVSRAMAVDGPALPHPRSISREPAPMRNVLSTSARPRSPTIPSAVAIRCARRNSASIPVSVELER